MGDRLLSVFSLPTGETTRILLLMGPASAAPPGLH